MPSALKDSNLDFNAYEVQLANSLLEAHGLQALVQLAGRVTSCGGESAAMRGSVFVVGGGSNNQLPIQQQHQQQHLHHAPLTYSDFATCGGLLKDAVMSSAVQALPSCMTSSFAIKQMKEQSRSAMFAAAKYEAKQQKLQDLQKIGQTALEVMPMKPFLLNPMTLAAQLNACSLQEQDSDANGAAAAGTVFAMLRDYSDFFDAMQAAAAVTDDALMQPYVAW
jgi:hypothetical protein